MNIPVWIKPAAYGAVLGGVAVAIVGFAWGGWVTGGSAEASAKAAADASRTDLAAAICVQNFMADDNARENLAELKELSRATLQRDYIDEGNWAAMPDRDEAARSTTTLCARMLAEIEPTELPVVEGGEVVEEGEVIEAEAMEAEEQAQPVEDEIAPVEPPVEDLETQEPEAEAPAAQ
ncbi:hypothetical protein [Pelagibacterium montanilacus]|uniref:hypothetical protein n=1 Tax=Pelagibacterium montanilacus TaxID=2185280 RepID=UPI000F8DCB7E|nr:hypothetical protein [Pelagibacterium montanilacus]